MGFEHIPSTDYANILSCKRTQSIFNFISWFGSSKIRRQEVVALPGFYHLLGYITQYRRYLLLSHNCDPNNLSGKCQALRSFALTWLASRHYLLSFDCFPGKRFPRLIIVFEADQGNKYPVGIPRMNIVLSPCFITHLIS